MCGEVDEGSVRSCERPDGVRLDAQCGHRSVVFVDVVNECVLRFRVCPDFFLLREERVTGDVDEGGRGSGPDLCFEALSGPSRRMAHLALQGW